MNIGVGRGLGPAPATYAVSRNYLRDCALLKSRHGPVIASASSVGKSTCGFSLDFPLGDEQAANEDAGFGVRYAYDSSFDRMMPRDHHRVILKFPRNKVVICIEEASDDLMKMFPGIKGNDFSLVSFYLREGARTTVNGFGKPFANKQNPHIEGLANGNSPIVEDITLLDISEQNRFHLFVAEDVAFLQRLLYLDDPTHSSRYPYGEHHLWNVARYKEQMDELKSAVPFPPGYNFANDNDHVTAVTQSNVQDIFWLQVAADQIASMRQPAYFVQPIAAAHKAVGCIRYLIFSHDGIPTSFKDAWRRLTKEPRFKVELYDDYDDEKPAAKWDCEIVSHIESVDALRGHHVDATRDLVLAVRLPSHEAKEGTTYTMKSFLSRSLANRAFDTGKQNWNIASIKFASQLTDTERLVNAACLFNPSAVPSNPRVCGLLGREDMSPKEWDEKMAEIEDIMDLHRALLRGNGFYEWMSRPATDITASMEAVSLQDKPRLRPLPTVNFLDTGDTEFIDAVIGQLLPADQERFRTYLSDRPLGLGLITAAAGLGKTTIMGVAAVIMQAKFGHILCSGPTHVAVSNFAERINRIIISVCAELNRDKSADDPNRRRHKLVVRAYKDRDEIDAVRFLLEHPEDGDRAIQKNRPWSSSRWCLDQSLAYWILVVLRSQAKGIRQLHPDDHQGLHALRQRIDESEAMKEIREVARGEMSWAQYVGFNIDTSERIRAILQELFSLVDILCTTPAATVNVRQYSLWKNTKAKAIAVDEAAAMHRADLYCVWGNTMLPCFLGGDANQLSPAVLTEREKNADGTLINRFASTGKISALEFFQASGMPVFRMRLQLRMACGLFDIVSQTIYDTSARYHEFCDIDQEKFRAGRVLEEYIRSHYPTVSPPPEGKLSPLFLHCPNTKISVDPTTGSKKSVDQVKVALNFVSDLVKSTEVKASQVIILSPYAANVELIRTLVQDQQYAKTLAGMGQSSTIDGYQGQERDVVVVVMGTRAGYPGPGFTANRQRLNVLLTRQRCGLVIVGDIHVTGQLETRRRDAGPRLGGASTAADAAPLRAVYTALCKGGRVATVDGY